MKKEEQITQEILERLHLEKKYFSSVIDTYAKENNLICTRVLLPLASHILSNKEQWSLTVFLSDKVKKEDNYEMIFEGKGMFAINWKPKKLKQENVSCYHRTQNRVLTHRGTHCGDCGKKF